MTNYDKELAPRTPAYDKTAKPERKAEDKTELPVRQAPPTDRPKHRRPSD